MYLVFLFWFPKEDSDDGIHLIFVFQVDKFNEIHHDFFPRISWPHTSFHGKARRIRYISFSRYFHAECYSWTRKIIHLKSESTKKMKKELSPSEKKLNRLFIKNFLFSNISLIFFFLFFFFISVNYHAKKDDKNNNKKFNEKETTNCVLV